MVNRTANISEFGTGRFLGSNMYQQIEIQFAIFKPSLFWVPFVQLGEWLLLFTASTTTSPEVRSFQKVGRVARLFTWPVTWLYTLRTLLALPMFWFAVFFWSWCSVENLRITKNMFKLDVLVVAVWNDFFLADVRHVSSTCLMWIDEGCGPQQSEWRTQQSLCRSYHSSMSVWKVESDIAVSKV